MRTYIPFLALCFAAPSSFALPVQVEPSQSLRQEGTIRARGDPNLASWVTAGVGGLAAALLGGYMTRDSPLPRKPQGELEILHEEAMKYRGSEPNTAACVYRKVEPVPRSVLPWVLETVGIDANTNFAWIGQRLLLEL